MPEGVIFWFICDYPWKEMLIQPTPFIVIKFIILERTLEQSLALELAIGDRGSDRIQNSIH